MDFDEDDKGIKVEDSFISANVNSDHDVLSYSGIHVQ